jgi:hypothetical protein
MKKKVANRRKKRKMKNVEKTSKAIEDYLEALLMLGRKESAFRYFLGCCFADESFDAGGFPNG